MAGPPVVAGVLTWACLKCEFTIFANGSLVGHRRRDSGGRHLTPKPSHAAKWLKFVSLLSESPGQEFQPAALKHREAFSVHLNQISPSY